MGESRVLFFAPEKWKFLSPLHTIQVEYLFKSVQKG